MASMTLNAEIMSFGFSGVLGASRTEDEADRPAAEPQRGPAPTSPPETVYRPVRSLLAQLRNPRL